MTARAYDLLDRPELTTDDEYMEHGISRVHRVLTEFSVEEPRYLIRVPRGPDRRSIRAG